jgi:hypothetical protein
MASAPLRDRVRGVRHGILLAQRPGLAPLPQSRSAFVAETRYLAAFRMAEDEPIARRRGGAV